MHSPRRRSALKFAAAAGLALAAGACKREPKDSVKAVERAFSDGALRLDFRHSVGPAADTFALTQHRAEPKWGGRSDRLASPPDWGSYRLSLLDAGGESLFRTGFESPAESGAEPATTTLSLRTPLPRKALRAVIEKRRAESTWQSVWNADIDPATAVKPGLMVPRVEPLLLNGPPAEKVDIAILGDGYTTAQYAKFVGDALRALGYISSTQPYSLRMRDFNVYSVFSPSETSGVSDRFLGVQKDTAFGTTYYTGEAERTLAVENKGALYDAAGAVPYDFVLVLANSRRYGGSAHYGGPAMIAADSAAAKYLVLHELAHVIGGLAEEYYLPSAEGPVYRGNIEPWHPNVTLSPQNAKWKGEAGAAPPRREWNKAEYEKRFADYVKRYYGLRSARADEAEIEKLMREEQNRQATLLEKRSAREVGLYEGAHGYASGVFRSEMDCIMFSLQTDYFCAACKAALERTIDYHCK